MVEITLGETKHNLRTSWNEVTMKDYCEIVKAKDKPLQERLSLYAGVDVANLKVSQSQVIVDIVGFMDEPETVTAFSISYESDVKIPEQPYWKLEKCKQLLKDNPNPITSACEVVDIYTSDDNGKEGKKIADEPVTKVIGMAAFFLTSCQNSLKDING